MLAHNGPGFDKHRNPPKRPYTRHRLYQYISKFFRLTHPVGRGLRLGHENKPLSTQDRKNPGHRNLFGLRRDGRCFVLVGRISGSASWADHNPPDGQPDGSERQRRGPDGCRSVALRNKPCFLAQSPMERCPFLEATFCAIAAGT
jgi:hypothetical protein